MSDLGCNKFPSLCKNQVPLQRNVSKDKGCESTRLLKCHKERNAAKLVQSHSVFEDILSASLAAVIHSSKLAHINVLEDQVSSLMASEQVPSLRKPFWKKPHKS
eukprot:2026600-Amphidinium_carterae.1